MTLKSWGLLCVLGGFIGLGVAVFMLRPFPTESRDLSGLVGDVKRGAYLARASGCFSCHSAKGKPVLSGGGPLKTPFGTFYAPNLTTHPEDGIGKWTAAQFSAALTQGISPQGENYFPSFLYPNYTKLSNQDVVDLWAAFKTVPPVAGKAPNHDILFPFNQRVLLNGWKRLFFQPGAYKPDPTKTDSENRGAFLATGPTHCVACHTPRNLFGARDLEHELEGTANGPEGEKVPAISGASLKKNGWNKTSIIFALKTGSTPSGDAFGGSMGHVVTDSTRYLSNTDLEALADYLLSIDKSK